MFDTVYPYKWFEIVDGLSICFSPNFSDDLTSLLGYSVQMTCYHHPTPPPYRWSEARYGWAVPGGSCDANVVIADNATTPAEIMAGVEQVLGRITTTPSEEDCRRVWEQVPEFGLRPITMPEFDAWVQTDVVPAIRQHIQAFLDGNFAAIAAEAEKFRQVLIWCRETRRELQELGYVPGAAFLANSKLYRVRFVDIDVQTIKFGSFSLEWLKEHATVIPLNQLETAEYTEREYTDAELIASNPTLAGILEKSPFWASDGFGIQQWRFTHRVGDGYWCTTLIQGKSRKFELEWLQSVAQEVTS